jgi:hypothetical protein
MDASQLQLFLKKAQRGARIRRVTEHPDWEAMRELIENLRDENDTVRGVETDKEWMRRKERVAILDELLAIIQSTIHESSYALNELRRDQEEDSGAEGDVV